MPVVCHFFLDGRDTPPKSALEYLARFEKDVAGEKNIAIGTVGGRYYAMDRDKRWDRVAKGYAAIIAGEGDHAPSAKAAIEAGYAAGKTDEFVPPTAIAGYAGMRDGDGLVMANFRADRVRQILTALLDPKFTEFERGKTVRFAAALGMTQYSAALDLFLATLFPAERLDQTFGELVAKAGLKQLRIAETEKFAHVTYFFNGGREQEFPGEDRILVPSPKVATYDLKPEMSAIEVTDKLVEAIGTGTFDVDRGQFRQHRHGRPYRRHGGGDQGRRNRRSLSRPLGGSGGEGRRRDPHYRGPRQRRGDARPQTRQPHTAHTTNPVPIVLVNGPPA